MNMLLSTHSIDTAVIKMQERNVETCRYELSTMAVGLLFHIRDPHNYKVQCSMVIALARLQAQGKNSEPASKARYFVKRPFS